MPKFKEGDRVRVVYEHDDPAFGSGSGTYHRIGWEGEVITVRGILSGDGVCNYKVQVDDGEEYTTYETELELISGILRKSIIY